MTNNIEVDVTANASDAAGEIGKVGDSAKNTSKVIVGAMGDSEQAFDTAARGTGKLGDALDKTEGVTGKLGDGVSGVSDVIDSFNDISNHGAEKQRALARAQIDVEQASTDLKQAVEDASQAQRDLAQSGIDASQAQLDQKQAVQDAANAQKQYNEDVKEHGKNSAEAKQDLIDMTQAQIDLKQAQEDGKQAERDAAQAKIDGTQATVDQKSATVDLQEAQSNLASQTSKLGKISDYANLFGSALSGLSAIIGLITVVQWAWNASLLANPITWIVLGIIALIAIIVLLATKTKFFQTIWDAVWGFMKAIGKWFAGPFVNFMKEAWDKIVEGVKWVGRMISNYVKMWIDVYIGLWHGIQNVAGWISGKWDWLVGKLIGAKNRLSSGLSSMWNGLWSGFKWVINNIVRGWNMLHFGIPGFSFAGIHVGGFSIGVPRLPYLAAGGDVIKSGLAYIHQGERVTTAADAQRYNTTRGTQPDDRNIRITLEFKGHGNDALEEWMIEYLKHNVEVKAAIDSGIRDTVRNAGNGSVQVAYGRRGVSS